MRSLLSIIGFGKSKAKGLYPKIGLDPLFYLEFFLEGCVLSGIIWVVLYVFGV